MVTRDDYDTEGEGMRMVKHILSALSQIGISAPGAGKWLSSSTTGASGSARRRNKEDGRERVSSSTADLHDQHEEMEQDEEGNLTAHVKAVTLSRSPWYAPNDMTADIECPALDGFYESVFRWPRVC